MVTPAVERRPVLQEPVRGGVWVELVLGDLARAALPSPRRERRRRSRARSRSATIAQTCASARASLAAAEASARPTRGGGPARPAAPGTPSPVAAVVISTSGRFGRGRAVGHRPVAARRRGHQHRAQLGRGPLRARLVALVDHDEVGHLEQAGLDRLDLVAHLGRLEDDRRVRRGRDLDLALPGPDGLDEDQVEPGRVEHRGRRRRGRRQPAGVPARRHRADEDVAVVGVGLHPHAVAEQRPTGDRARRIDRDDAPPSGRAGGPRRSARRRASTCPTRAAR